MCDWTQNGFWDAFAQLVIGILLAAVGLFLLWRNRGALIGQQICPKKLETLSMFLADLDGVDRVTDLKTRQLTATAFRMKAEVVFSGGWLAGRLMTEWSPRFRETQDPDAMRQIIGRSIRRTVTREELWNGNREPWGNLTSLRPERSVIAWAFTRHPLYEVEFSQWQADPQWAHARHHKFVTHMQAQQWLVGLAG